jgi:hypothetical protein
MLDKFGAPLAVLGVHLALVSYKMHLDDFSVWSLETYLAMIFA